MPNKTLEKYLKTAFQHFLAKELDAMPQNESSKHVADNDDLLLRWETGDISAKEHLEITEHLRRCPYCLKQVGEMVQAGVLALPEPIAPDKSAPIQSDSGRKKKRFSSLIRSIAASLMVVWMLAVSSAVFGPPTLRWMKDTVDRSLGSAIDGGVCSYPGDSPPPDHHVTQSGCGGSINFNTNLQIQSRPPISVETCPKICIYQQKLDGTIERLSPEKWSQFGSANEFLDQIVVFELPEKASSKLFVWTDDEAEVEWKLTILKSPSGFTLIRNHPGYINSSRIDVVVNKGFKVFCPSPRPDVYGGEEY